MRSISSNYGCQYREGNSPVHRMGALMKLMVGMLLAAAAVIAREPWALALVLGLNLAYYFGARLTLADFWQDTRYLFVQMLVIVALYAIRYGFPEGLGASLRVSSQIALFFIPGVVFLRTTKASEMMRGLSRILPYRLSFLVFTSFRFVPFFAREIREIVTAQRLRGARLTARDVLHPETWKDSFSCLMIPLVVRALKTADEASVAARARGFGSRPQRTYYDPHCFSGTPAVERPEKPMP